MAGNERGRVSTALLAGAGLGAAAMYLLDRERGAYRRAVARDKARSMAKHERELFDKGARDLRNRMQGVRARAESALHREPPSDDLLRERVRARIGRAVAHPHSIAVTVSDGRVLLRGPILSSEVGGLLDEVRSVPGVRDVANELDAHERAERISGLQGEGKRPSSRAREGWAPRWQLVGGGLGIGLAAAGARRSGALGTGLAMAGALLLLRASTNQPIGSLLGLTPGRRGVDVRKTITIDAPVERVFTLWDGFEQLPRFMEHVHDVRLSEGGQRSHWEVEGLTGRVAFDAETTTYEPGRAIAWKTLPGQAIEHAGIVRFESAGDRATRVDVQLTYRPPGGRIGHEVARIFGKDPKTALDEDLLRMKSLLEGGKTRAHGEEVRAPGGE